MTTTINNSVSSKEPVMECDRNFRPETSKNVSNMMANRAVPASAPHRISRIFFNCLPIKKAVFAKRANTAGTFQFPEVKPEENSDHFGFCSLAISARNSDKAPEGSFRPLALAARAQSRSSFMVRALTSRTKKLSALMTFTPFFCMFARA